MAVRHQMNVVRSERMCPGTLEAFSLPIGGGAPCREAGGIGREVRKDPRSKALAAFLSRGDGTFSNAVQWFKKRRHLPSF